MSIRRPFRFTDTCPRCDGKCHERNDAGEEGVVRCCLCRGTGHVLRHVAEQYRRLGLEGRN